jgi:hypothetical protein
MELYIAEATIIIAWIMFDRKQSHDFTWRTKAPGSWIRCHRKCGLFNRRYAPAKKKLMLGPEKSLIILQITDGYFNKYCTNYLPGSHFALHSAGSKKWVYLFNNFILN